MLLHMAVWWGHEPHFQDKDWLFTLALSDFGSLLLWQGIRYWGRSLT